MDATILPGPGIKARPPRARTDGERHSIQSVDRALFLLETIAEAGGEATLTDLSVRTGLNISTCHHLLATLIQRGFAAKVPGRRLYALGARILYLGHACLQVDLPRRAQPFLEAINAATGETVHIAVLARRQRRHSGAARSPPRRARRLRPYRQDRCAACDIDRQGDDGLAARRRNEAHGRARHEAIHRAHHHRLPSLDRRSAARAPQRLCHRSRRIPARRDLRRRCDPRSGRRL